MAGPEQIEVFPDEEETSTEAIEIFPDEDALPEPGKISPQTVANSQTPTPAPEMVVPEEKPDTTTPLEATGRGLRSGATYFLDDEIDGAYQAGYGVMDRATDRISDAVKSGNISDVATNPISEFKKLVGDYKFYRDDTRSDNRVAAEEHPFITGSTRVAGALLNPLTYAGGPAAGKVLGAVGGFGASEGDAGDTVKSTLLGAGLGALGSRYMGGATPQASNAIVQAADKVARPLVRYGLPATALGNAVFNEDMPEADRWSSGIGAAMSIPMLAGDFAKFRADKAATAGQKARSELADDITRTDFANDKEDQTQVVKLIKDVKKFDADTRKQTVADTHAKEKEAWKQQVKEVNDENKLAKLNAREAELAEKKGFREQKKRLDEYKGREKDTNKKYQDWLKQKTKEVQVRAKVRRDRTKQRAALVKALAEAEEASKSLDASAEGVYAQAFQNLANRSRTARDIYKEEGLPVPQEVADATKYTNESYMKNTKDKLVYPEQAKENFLAQAKANSDQQILNARKALEQFDGTPFDENSEVAKLLAPVPDKEAYEYAKSLGLNPGELEKFKARDFLPLNEQAPELQPLPSPEDRGLTKVDTERALLLKDKPELKLTPEKEIIKQAGLDKLEDPAKRIFFRPRSEDRAPVPVRVEEQISRAKPEAMSKVKTKAAIGAGIPMGVGGVASVAGNGGLVGQVGALGGGILAGTGAYLGAKSAIRELSRVNVKTGKYENPEAVAAVMDSIAAVLRKYNFLDTKYGRVFRQGVTPVQAMFYIKNDPDLAKALDENEAESAR